MNKRKEKLSVKAMINAGEVEVFDRSFFVKHGKLGGKKSAKQWETLDEKARSKRAKKGWETRRKQAQ